MSTESARRGGEPFQVKENRGQPVRKKPEKTGSKLLFFGVVQILGAEDEIRKNVLESPFHELSNNSSTVPGRRPGGTY